MRGSGKNPLNIFNSELLLLVEEKILNDFRAEKASELSHGLQLTKKTSQQFRNATS